MVDGFPNDVKEFIRRHIHSLAQHEVLLTLHREPERLWTVDEVTSTLYLQRQMVNDLLLDVVRRGLAEQVDGNFRYRPADEIPAGLIDRLAQLYPHANKLTVHILAAVAEHELDLIRKRTKAGLRNARRAGQRLGAANPNCRTLTDTVARRGRRLGAAAIRHQAMDAYASLLPQI